MHHAAARTVTHLIGVMRTRPHARRRHFGDRTRIARVPRLGRERDMNEHEEIAKALMARLSELRTHLAKVERSLHKPLPADSEDQAIELENQQALEVIEKTETTEIHQIEAALKRISKGTYGTCAKCGEPIDPRRAGRSTRTGNARSNEIGLRVPATLLARADEMIE